VVAAMLVWVRIFFTLVRLGASSGQAFLSVAFFISLFSILGVFYNNIAIEVLGDGLIVRGITSFRMVPFDDILKIDVKPGILQTVYAVRARRGPVAFTSLFSNHQRLMNLIVERAALVQN